MHAGIGHMGGVPLFQGWIEYPPPTTNSDWMGVPHRRETEQLHGGWYASRVHAG